VKLSHPIIFAVDGISGSGKSTASKVIAEYFDAKLLCGDGHLLDFIEQNSSLMKSIFGHPVGDLTGLQYFDKYVFQSVEQYVELHKRAHSYVEEKVYNEIRRHLNRPVVFDFVTSSTMYPWVGEPVTEKVIVTAEPQKRRKAILERDKAAGLLGTDPIVFEQGQRQLIKPEQANFEIINNHDTIELFGEKVREDVCKEVSQR